MVMMYPGNSTQHPTALHSPCVLFLHFYSVHGYPAAPSTGKGTEVKEGTMTLQVAKLLKPMLEEMGAEVFLTRDQTEPATNMRPADFEEAAANYLRSIGKDPDKHRTRSG